MSLSDADLDRAEAEWWGNGPHPLVAEIRRLRARVVRGTNGPDQGDPAAWAIYGGVTGDYKGVTDDDEEAESKRAGGYRVVPLGPLRAPGAVAAAPPGDEEADADLREIIEQRRDEGYVDGSQTRTRARLDAGWRLVPPAAAPGAETATDENAQQDGAHA